MSSEFSSRLAAVESASSGGYRLISVREVVKPNGLTDTYCTFRIDPPDEFITMQFDEREHVFLAAGLDGEVPCLTEAGECGRNVCLAD